MNSWSLQDAKARFSEFVRLVKASGPHVVTVRGKPEVVLMSMKDYEALQERRPSLASLMKSSPLADMELSVDRKSSKREFDL